jgi:hypothetical protein
MAERNPLQREALLNARRAAEQAAAVPSGRFEKLARDVTQAVVDISWLAERGALTGVAEIIAERKRQVELGDGHGDGWLRGSLHGWLACNDWDRQSLREAGALIAAEIDGLDRER